MWGGHSCPPLHAQADRVGSKTNLCHSSPRRSRGEEPAVPPSGKINVTTTPQPEAQPHLIRALGRRDLVLLFVVAVFNLNVVPSIAANGGVTIWLWIISLLLFFWPQ